jgi:hypothetical protein
MVCTGLDVGFVEDFCSTSQACNEAVLLMTIIAYLLGIFAITVPHLEHFVSSSGWYIRFMNLAFGSGEGSSKRTVLNVIVFRCPQEHSTFRVFSREFIP